MKKRINSLICLAMIFVLMASLLLTGCGSTRYTAASDTKETAAIQDDIAADEKVNTTENMTETPAITQEAATEKEETTEDAAIVAATDAPELTGLTCEGKMKLDYATGYDVYYYQDGYKLIDVHDSAQYLVVPEGKEAPADLSMDIQILQQPLDKIYLAATAAMALFRGLDALNTIRLTGTDASGWYVEEATKALEDGTMLFAGKYSEPDYEMLVDEECDLAIESTMILHSPKVQEMIQDLDIPVFIDRASYESHPLGRTEWIKLYGAMLNEEDQANIFFDDQSKIMDQLAGFENTEKTVAFFYVKSDGTVAVRSASDYIPSMIEIAGGRYMFSDLNNEDSTSTTVTLSMEEFYTKAINADYLVYNGTIDSPIASVDDLVAKSALFADFKAVKDGNVWTIGKDLYQATDIVGKMITDINLMLTDGDASQMTFLAKVN